MVWSVVKWFKPEKGFGFVELSDGSGDAFLHGSVLARSINAVQPGETLEVRVGPGHKGPHVTEVLSVDNSTAVPTTPRRATFQAVISSEPSVEETGTVKWFNVVKGFGWIDGRADGTPAIVCGDFNATLDASSAGLMATRFRPTQTCRRRSPRSPIGTARSRILTGRGWTVASITSGFPTASRSSPARSVSIARARTIRRCGRPTMPVCGPTCGYEKVFPRFRLGFGVTR